MLCDRCKNIEAFFHFTDVSDIMQREIHLCNNCIGEVRLDEQIENNTILLKKLISLVNTNISQNQDNNTMCLICGLTEMEFNLNKRQGCPSCHRYFKSILQPVNTTNKKWYSGKKPLNYIEVMTEIKALSENNNLSLAPAELEEELKKAIIEERYEDAAIFRDQLKKYSPEKIVQRN